MNKWSIVILAAFVSACQPSEEAPPAEPAAEIEPALASEPAAATADEDVLAMVLAGQPDDAKARYEYRHPGETIDFKCYRPDCTLIGGRQNISADANGNADHICFLSGKDRRDPGLFSFTALGSKGSYAETLASIPDWALKEESDD